MKISIKEIKVEDDGCEILYIRDFGFVLKSETFSGALKRCHEKGKEEKGKEKEKEIDFEALAPILSQIVSQLINAQKQAEGAPPAAGTKIPVE
jgi:hypothetical protein